MMGKGFFHSYIVIFLSFSKSKCCPIGPAASKNFNDRKLASWRGWGYKFFLLLELFFQSFLRMQNILGHKIV